MILVTGGAGVMGSVLVRRLAQQGSRVRVCTLAGDPNIQRICDVAADIRYADISCHDDVVGLCDQVKTVYHLAAIIIARDDALYERINVNGTREMIEEARRAGVEHFIYVSSASVVYPRSTPYSRSKRMCEDMVRSSGLNYTIIRPTLVYDKHGGQEFDMFVAYLRRFPVVPFIGTGLARKRPVFVNDIIDGLLALHANQPAYGKTYNFSGAESITMLEFSRLCLRLMGREKKPIVHLPVWLCRGLALGMRVGMKHPPLSWPVIAGITQDADLDPAEATAELGYTPVGVREKLPQCFPRA